MRYGQQGTADRYAADRGLLPGKEDTPDDASYVQETGHPAYRADDALWLFPTVYKYISETGNTAFLDEVIPFANKDEATVYEHLKRAVAFSLNHLDLMECPPDFMQTGMTVSVWVQTENLLLLLYSSIMQ